MMPENERIDNNRHDIIGSPLDQKIEKKVSYVVFISVVSGISVAALFIFGIVMSQLSGLNNRVGQLEQDTAVLESKIDANKKQN